MRNKTREWSELTITGCTVRERVDSGLIRSCHCLQCSLVGVAKQNLPVIWFITDDVYSPCIHLHFWLCACNESSRGSTTGENVITISVLHVGTNLFSGSVAEDWGSICAMLITILSDTHSHSVLVLLLNRELSRGPWSFMPGKLDPGEGVAGTDVRLQEPLEAPGFSMTLASVLFGSERPRDHDTWSADIERQQWKSKGDEWDVGEFHYTFWHWVQIPHGCKIKTADFHQKQWYSKFCFVKKDPRDFLQPKPFEKKREKEVNDAQYSQLCHLSLHLITFCVFNRGIFLQCSEDYWFF